MSGIRFDKVTRTFEQKCGSYIALRPITLHIPDGEFVAIVGPSGCGKTTLLRMAAGLDFPTTGTLTIGSEPVKGPGPDRAVVFQQFALLPWKTVRQNIGFGLKCSGMSSVKAKPLIDRYLKIMQLEAHAESYPHQLSGGMQQRVAIARSFILEPEVLLMDEPFGALDAQTRIEMQEELIRLTRGHPRTVLFITHSVEEATYLADRVIVMAGRPGTIREIVDIASIRRAERWAERPIEDVMELDSFVRLRTRLWRLLRSLEEPTHESTQSLRLAIAS
ncbi:ABC transporter ATP-binding protein [Paraburkholderia caribensis]|uniref:ABC transporter ATP-binding protein n=1 Tax=Paraburkholderia TaxID=1822464 RepID=UPI001CABB8D7|nr:ABC transporter ATP-binding protein [Paraburkholderia caribensis]BEU25634.1 ABC transporter ATP-binding protein [Paraburkholderia sp. 22B1P]CAG9262463.1 Nitrate ABC transporter ATP-binding protein [Paraburkholderia caribensis]